MAMAAINYYSNHNWYCDFGAKVLFIFYVGNTFVLIIYQRFGIFIVTILIK